MPIYEYLCRTCFGRFSLLRPMQAAHASTSCGVCGGESDRAVSNFAVSTGGKPQPAMRPERSPSRGVRQAPLCLQRPEVPLLCHMAPGAAEAWVARANGRHEQYQEKEARSAETRQAEGLPAKVDDASAHAHAHVGGHHPVAQLAASVAAPGALAG